MSGRTATIAAAGVFEVALRGEGHARGHRAMVRPHTDAVCLAFPPVLRTVAAGPGACQP